MCNTDSAGEGFAFAKAPVAFIGAGNLAWSLASGIIAAGVVSPASLRVTNRRDESHLGRFAALGATTGRDLELLLRGVATVVLLFKPADATDALAALRGRLRQGTLLISAVAGLPIEYIRSAVGEGVHIVRAMPNTASEIRLAATAISASAATPVECLQWAEQLFGAVGSVHHVAEAALDAVTAVSGSGPAYVYYFAELLIEAAKAAGLGPLLAHALAIETLAGAAAMLNQPGADPAVLKARVASPRGTTEAGLAAMTDLGIGDAVHAAVRTAAARSREISAVFAQPLAGQVQGN